MSTITEDQTAQREQEEKIRYHEQAKRNIWEETLRDQLRTGQQILTALSIADQASDAYDKKFSPSK